MRTFERFVLAAAAAATLILSGCSSTTREPVDLKKINELVRIERVWSTSLGESINGMLTPVVTEAGIFAAGDDEVFKIDPRTGDKIWRAKAQAEVSAGVGSDGNYVAIVNARGELEVFDGQGKELWRTKLSSAATVPPLVGSGFIIVRTDDTRISAYDAASGERKWRYQSQVPSLTVRVASKMRFSPAGVLVGQSNGKLLALGPDGRQVFDAVIAQAHGITEVERLCDVVGTPYVDQNMMCAAAFQGNVLCMSSQNGRTLWHQPADAVSGPVSDGVTVFVSTSNGNIKAFDYTTGNPVWTNEDLRWRSPSAPVVIGVGLVAVADFDGEIHVMDSSTGEIIGRRSISDQVIAAPIPMQDGALFQTKDGELVLVRTVR
ncbi:MAG: outer membrane protein assembly factor BamB [Duodenibacillus sp.]|nr:outer membrane protein assembly factor BamB [Duodenibacillus sp.]HBC70328.1 outer membrane protein assembly factor BamB [Sutterella sp.]